MPSQSKSIRLPLTPSLHHSTSTNNQTTSSPNTTHDIRAHALPDGKNTIKLPINTPRTILPTQNPHETIGLQIFHHARLSKPDYHLINERHRLVYQISQIINRSKIGKRPPGMQPYTLRLFGSISFGLDSIDSDLDICILDPDRPQGLIEGENSSPKALPKIYNVKLLSHIFNYAQFQDVKPIPLAKAPILKLRSPNGRFSIDLNCNNLLGCRNSELINAYRELSPQIFRPLGLVVKQWAKSRGYCDPSGSQGPISASSYTLILLLIGYLQVINHLPNLQDQEYIQRLFGRPNPDLIYVKKSTQSQQNHKAKKSAGTTHQQNDLVAINTSFVKAPPDSFGWIQHHSAHLLSDPGTLSRLVFKLLLGFFEFYDEFDFESFIISIRDGKPVRRAHPAAAAAQTAPSHAPEIGRQRGAGSQEEGSLGMERLLAGLKDDLRDTNRYPRGWSEEDESEDEITYIPFVYRQGIPEDVQRELDSEALRRRKAAHPLRISAHTGLETGAEESLSDSTRASARCSPKPTHALLHPTPPPSTRDHPRLPAPSSASSSLSLSSSPPPSRANNTASHNPTLLHWPHPLVVVDPFLYARNTAGNIKPHVLDEIKDEFSRARRVLASGGSLEDLFFS